MYLFFRIVCQTPSSVRNLKNVYQGGLCFNVKIMNTQPSLIFRLADHIPSSRSIFVFFTFPLPNTILSLRNPIYTRLIYVMEEENHIRHPITWTIFLIGKRLYGFKWNQGENPSESKRSNE